MIDNPHALSQYLEFLGDEGTEFIVEIIDTFLADAPNNFQLLDTSIAIADYPTFRRAAHTLKTGCATVGAVEFSNQFLVLEQAGATNDLTTIGGLLEQSKLEYQKLKTELEQQKTHL